MDKLTKLAIKGRASGDYAGAVNTPVIRTSTVLFDDFAECNAAMEGKAGKIAYGRHGTATRTHLQDFLAALDEADKTFLYPSGQAACAMALFSVLNPGDHLLMVDTAYDPVRKFCDSELKRLGIETTYYDPMAGAGIAQLMKPNTKAVYVESPGSVTFEVQDIPAIAEVAHKHGAAVIADNTWGTPLSPNLFDLGVDMVIHALTKYACGHADVLMGSVSARGDYVKKLDTVYKHYGFSISPDDCYLMQRGLRTLGARLAQQEATALTLAEWFKARPETIRLLHPAFASCPGHEFWKRDIGRSCGLFSVVIKPQSEKALAAMFDGMELFAMGFSWGGYESLMLRLNPERNRSAKPWTEEGTLLRLHAGLESPADLIADLEAGFKRMNAVK